VPLRRTNFILRIKEQETRLTLPEHDDDEQNLALGQLVPVQQCVFRFIGLPAFSCALTEQSHYYANMFRFLAAENRKCTAIP